MLSILTLAIPWGFDFDGMSSTPLLLSEAHHQGAPALASAIRLRQALAKGAAQKDAYPQQAAWQSQLRASPKRRALKRRLLGCGLVEMERLRIELSGKALDILAADNSFWALEAHAHCEIFKPFDH